MIQLCALVLLLALLLGGCGPGSLTGICLFDARGLVIFPTDCREVAS